MGLDMVAPLGRRFGRMALEDIRHMGNWWWGGCEAAFATVRPELNMFRGKVGA
jgi:hypothetical protein